MRIAVIADIHACYPWMSEERVGEIVDLANAQKPVLGSTNVAIAADANQIRDDTS